MASVESKIRGWKWVADECRRAATAARAEAERLLGPDRGQ